VSGQTGSSVIKKNAPNRKWKTSTASLPAQFLKTLIFKVWNFTKKIMLKYNKPVKKSISHHRPEKKYRQI
jgi:hypothetical protein